MPLDTAEFDLLRLTLLRDFGDEPGVERGSVALMASVANTMSRVLLYTGPGIVVAGSFRATELVCVSCVLGIYDGTVLVIDGHVIHSEQSARDAYQQSLSPGVVVAGSATPEPEQSVSPGVVVVASAVGGSVAFLGVCLYVTWRKMQGSADNGSSAGTANSVGDTQHSRVPTTTQSLYPVTGFVSTACDSHEYMLNPYHAVPSPYHGMVSPYGESLGGHHGMVSPYNGMLSPYNGMLSPYNGYGEPLGAHNSMAHPYHTTPPAYNV